MDFLHSLPCLRKLMILRRIIKRMKLWEKSNITKRK